MSYLFACLQESQVELISGVISTGALTGENVTGQKKSSEEVELSYRPECSCPAYHESCHDPSTGAQVFDGESHRSKQVKFFFRLIFGVLVFLLVALFSINHFYPSLWAVITSTCTTHEMTQEKAQRFFWDTVKNYDGLGVEEAVLCGADLEAKDDNHMTALSLVALSCETVGVLRVLIRLGANVGSRSGENLGTPLHYAAMSGDESCVSQLLEAGADVNSLDRYRSTPLHWLTEKGSRRHMVRIAKLLIGAGADVNARNEFGCSPLCGANMRFRHALSAYLKSVGGVELWK